MDALDRRLQGPQRGLPLGPAPRPPLQPQTGLFQASTQPLRVRATQFRTWGFEAEAPRSSRRFFLVQAPPGRSAGGSLTSSAALQVGPALGAVVSRESSPNQLSRFLVTAPGGGVWGWRWVPLGHRSWRYSRWALRLQ